MQLDWNKINKPLVLKTKSEIESKDYFFRNQLLAIEKFIDQNIDNQTSTHNKVIGIIGGRGSGKSSLLGTVSNLVKNKDGIVIGPIDPSVFVNSLNISELVLSNIFKEIKKMKNSVNLSSDEEDTLIKIYNKIIKAVEILNIIRIDSTTYIESNVASGVLEDNLKKVEFDEIFRDIFKKYASLHSNKKHIVILIDDIDLVENEKIYKMLEDIRKFFTNNAIVILSYREEQLHNAVVQNLIIKNKNLLSNEIIGLYELNDQASRYIEKLIPSSNKVYLPTENQLYATRINDLLKPFLLSDFTNEIKNNDLQVKMWLIEELEKKLRITLSPVDRKEASSNQFPSNLRGTLNLIKFIDTTLFEFDENDKIDDKCEIVLKNIELFKNYFKSSLSERIPNSLNKIILEWDSSETDVKNYYIYRSLFDYFELVNNKDVESKLIDINRIQPYNICIADVYKLFEFIKATPSKNMNNAYFIYSLKVLYSLELITLYTKAVADNDLYDKTNQTDNDDSETNIYLEQYLQLLNCNIIPEYILDDLKENYSTLTFDFFYNKENESENKLLLDMLTYNVNSVNSKVQISTRPMVGDKVQSNLGYQYRRAFSYDECNYVTTYRYAYDPFAFLGKRKYVYNAIKYIKQDINAFVVLTLFDIDRLLMMNYTRQTENNPVKYMFRRINAIITGDDLRDTQQVEHLYKLGIPLFFSKDKKYIAPFNDGLLNVDIRGFDVGLTQKTKLYRFIDRSIKKDLDMEGKIRKKLEGDKKMLKSEMMDALNYTISAYYGNLGEHAKGLENLYTEFIVPKSRVSQRQIDELHSIVVKLFEQK